MLKRIFQPAALAALLVVVSTGIAFADCTRDKDVNAFTAQRDAQERLIVQGWLHGQLDQGTTAAITAEILSWELRIVRLCGDEAFLERHLHLITQENVTADAVPARLFVETMRRDGMLDGRPHGWMRRSFALYRRGAP